MRSRVFYLLRVSQPHSGDADGGNVRHRLSPLRFRLRDARRRHIRSRARAFTVAPVDAILPRRPRLLPPQKFLEQFIGTRRRNRCALGAALLRRELTEIRLQARNIRAAGRCEPFLRRLEALPVFQSDCKIDLAPFGMVRRLAKLLDLGEERIDEPLNAAVAIGVFRPVISDQDHFVGDGLDDLAGRDLVRIIFVREFGRQVLCLRDLLRERDRDEVYSVLELHIGDELRGFAGDVSGRGDLTGLEHFKRLALDDVDHFDLDTEALENVAHGLTGAAARLVDVDFAAVEVSDRRDVAGGDQVHLFIEQLGDVDDLVVILAERLIGAAKAVKHAQLGEADVHPFEIPHVANILRTADADDRQDPEPVGVVEHVRHIVRDLQVSVVRAGAAGNDRYGIFVDLLVSVNADDDAIIRIAHSFDIARFIVDLLSDGTEPSKIDPALSGFADRYLFLHEIFAVLVAEIPQIGTRRHRRDDAIRHDDAVLVDDVGVKIAVDCSGRDRKSTRLNSSHVEISY